MSAEAKRTIGFICPKCRKSVIVERSVFSLTSAPTKIACPCGGSEVKVEYQGDRFLLEAPCPACGGRHTAKCPNRPFLHQHAMGFSCGKTGMDVCYVGEEKAVFEAVSRMEQAVDHLDRQKEEPGSFLNELVMTEVLGELKDIAQRDGISCTCGSRRWKLKVHYADLEISCADCGGILRLNAGTMDDLNDLCCRNTLLIRGAKKS